MKTIKPGLRRQRQEQTSEQLNRVYSGKPDAAERSFVKKMKATFRSTIKERW